MNKTTLKNKSNKVFGFSKGFLTAGMMFLGAHFANAQYCVPLFPSGCGGGDVIKDFSITGNGVNFMDSGDCSPDSYADNTATVITLQKQLEYSFKTTHGYANQKVRIWVDWNNDNQFDETTEMWANVQSTGSGQNSKSEGTLLIPSTVAEGNYRLRVATRYGVNEPIPCNQEGFGEAQDYTLQVLAAPNCLAPTDLGFSNVTLEGVDLSWISTASTFDLEIVLEGENPTGTPTHTAVSNPFTVTGLLSGTAYNCYVRAVCDTETSVWSAPQRFVTLCDEGTIPYLQNFNVPYNTIPPCTMIVNGGSGNDWMVYSDSGTNVTDFDGNYLRYSYSVTQDANSWFITRGLQLEQNKTYKISYKYRVGSSNYSERFKVAYATSTNIDAMTTVLADHTNLLNTTIEINEVEFTVPEDGVYYFGFHVYSLKDKYRLYVDDIEIQEVTAPCGTVALPIAAANQILTEGQTLADLTVTGENLMWYSDAALQNALDVTTEAENGVTYYVTQSINGCQSEAVAITVEVTLSSNLVEFTSLKVYPNPVKESLTIVNGFEINKVEVTNMLGQVVAVKTINATLAQIEMNAIPAGNYLVKISVENGASQVIKVVKQ